MDEKYEGVSTFDLILEFIRISDEIYYRESTTRDKVSHFSKKASDLEHELEITPIDVFRGYNISKKLQRYLMLRRVVKRDDFIFTEIANKASELNFKKISAFAKNIHNLFVLQLKTKKKNDDWSNYAKLGKITYKEVEEEYGKKYGSLDDQLEKLKDFNKHNK